MALASTVWLTLAETKRHLKANLNSTADDTHLEALVTAACRAVEKYLGRNVVKRAYVETHDGSGLDFLHPRHPPATVTEVKEDSARAFAASSILATTAWLVPTKDDGEGAGGYVIERLDGFTFTVGKQTVRITYTGGWTWIVTSDAFAATALAGGGVGVKAALDLGTLADGNLDTVVEATATGVGGDSLTVALVGDSGAGAGVSITVSGNAITIHFEPGVSTVALVEAAITALAGGDDLIGVKTPGTAATVLYVPVDRVPGDMRQATHLVLKHLWDLDGGGKGLLGMTSASAGVAGSVGPISTIELTTAISKEAKELLASYRWDRRGSP